jgi:hypothetical protein
MSESIESQLKNKLNYTTSPACCKLCKYFKEDMTTDNFGPGDRCIRNPDISFKTNVSASCNGFIKYDNNP